MKKEIQELHDSYKSSSARQAVEYIWDVSIIDWDKGEVSFKKVKEIIKHIADNIEFLVNNKQKYD